MPTLGELMSSGDALPAKKGAAKLYGKTRQINNSPETFHQDNEDFSQEELEALQAYAAASFNISNRGTRSGVATIIPGTGRPVRFKPAIEWGESDENPAIEFASDSSGQCAPMPNK